MFNWLTYTLSSDLAAGCTSVISNIHNDLKLFKKGHSAETVNKESSPLFCPFAWESASFMLTETCGTEKSLFFLCCCRVHFWVDSSSSVGCSALLRGGVHPRLCSCCAGAGLSWYVRPAGMTHGSLSKRGKVFPEEFQLLQAFAKEILNWIGFVILIC